MNFFSGFGKGVAWYIKAFGFVFNKNLWHFIFYPLILWLAMYIVSFYLADSLGDYVQEWINAKIQSIPDEGHWLSWLKAFESGWLARIASWVLKFFLWIYSGTFMKYVTLILLSPVFSLLSEAVAVRLGGKSMSFDGMQLLKDILRGTLISLRNMLLEYLLLFVCFLLCVIFPPAAIVLTPFLFLAGWYFVGFSMLDYSCEREKMGVIQSIRFIRSNMGLACGIGFCYSITLWFPALGMMFGPVMAVSGATLAFDEIKKKETNVSKTI